MREMAAIIMSTLPNPSRHSCAAWDFVDATVASRTALPWARFTVMWPSRTAAQAIGTSRTNVYHRRAMMQE